MYTIESLTRKISRKIPKRYFYVTESIYLKDYLRVLPMRRRNRRKGSGNPLNTFEDGIRERFVKMFPEEFVSSSCIHVKKER